MHDPRKNPHPGSLGLRPVTGLAPEGGPIPPVGPGAGPAAPATLPGATAEVDEEEKGHAPGVAPTVVTEVEVDPTVAVIPGVAHIITGGGQGLGPMTAIQVEVAA